MTVEELVLKKLRALPLERHLELLDFAEFLDLKVRSEKKPCRSVKGPWAVHDIHITEDDIAEAMALYLNLPLVTRYFKIQASNIQTIG